MNKSLIASVLHLDRKAIKELKITDSYSLHRVVYSLFEDVRDEQEKSTSQTSGIAWADQGGDFAGRQILLLSDRHPTEQVDGQYGQVVSKSISTEFLQHSRYRFKVIVNPTYRNNSSRQLIPVKGREAIAQWFTHRAQQSWGFVVKTSELQVDKVQVLRFKDKSQREITLAQAHIQGTLEVNNRDHFKQSFSQGIGRARAFGCGLLQIVPLLDNPFE